MITPDGKFIKYDDYTQAIKEASASPMIEIICPKCKEMTRSEPITGWMWECLECGNIFVVELNNDR